MARIIAHPDDDLPYCAGHVPAELAQDVARMMTQHTGIMHTVEES